MNIKILGSGSSGNAYQIDDGKTRLLLDAGLPVRELQQLLEFQLNKVAGVLLTHNHGDHSKACKSLMKRGINVYTSQGTIEAMGWQKEHRAKRVSSMQAFFVGTMNILPFDVQHDAPEPLGYVVHSTELHETLLYFTDTYYLKYTFGRLDYIMGECNYDMEIIKEGIANGTIDAELAPRLMKSHMSLEHFLELLQHNDLSQVKQIYLLHLSNSNSNEQQFKEAVQKATGAEVYVC